MAMAIRRVRKSPNQISWRPKAWCPIGRPCCFQKFEATETILATGMTIWKPGFRNKHNLRVGSLHLPTCPCKCKIHLQELNTYFAKYSFPTYGFHFD